MKTHTRTHAHVRTHTLSLSLSLTHIPTHKHTHTDTGGGKDVGEARRDGGACSSAFLGAGAIHYEPHASTKEPDVSATDLPSLPAEIVEGTATNSCHEWRGVRVKEAEGEREGGRGHACVLGGGGGR